MWSTEVVINGLKKHRQTCAKISVIENMFENDSNSTPVLKEMHYDLLREKKTIESWLSILPTEERFIVQTHLVDGLDWAKTLVEYEKMWGIVNGRSERTLKRIQSKAIERIITCLDQIDKLTKSETKEVE